MTEAVSLKPDLGRFGVFLATRSITPELAKEIESLGYGAVWIAGSPDAELTWVDPALAQTSSLQLATGMSTSGPRRHRRSPSPMRASKAPTPEGFCSASGRATASTPRST
jgi:hypothetical protein